MCSICLLFKKKFLKKKKVCSTSHKNGGIIVSREVKHRKTTRICLLQIYKAYTTQFYGENYHRYFTLGYLFLSVHFLTESLHIVLAKKKLLEDYTHWKVQIILGWSVCSLSRISTIWRLLFDMNRHLFSEILFWK